MAVYATIAALNIYPVKSCRGIALNQAILAPTGLACDRRWMVVTDTGRFLTQRELPRLALVAPTVNGHELRLSAPGMIDLHLSAASDRQRVQVTIWRDRCSAFDEGPQAAAWLSQFLAQTVRLVRFDPAGKRPSACQWTGDTQALNKFTDGFPVLVVSQASLGDLNERLETLLPMNRFRPNVVLDGVQAYDEDRIHELSDGDVRLRLVKPCTRCKITTTDQATADVMGAEPLATLKSYRWSRELNGAMFGQNAIIAGGIGAELRVGQRLAITWKDRSNG